MSNILVLGATGKLGGFLRRIWMADGTGARVSGWVGRGDAAPLRWRPGDDPAVLPRADSVVALWGVTTGTEAELAANADLALAAIAVGTAVGARRVLHCSSAAVYGGGSANFEEADTCAPRNPYGRAKLEMERAIAARSPDGPVSCALRIANVAGADQLFASLDRGGDVVLDRFADGGGPRRSYLAPRDLAAALLRLCDLPPEDLPPVMNLAGPAPVGMDEIVRAAGREPGWRDAPVGALQTMALSDARLRRLMPPLAASADAAALVADWRSMRGVAA